MGAPYSGEYGERIAARRRGLRFEAFLHSNDAAELRRAVGPVFGLDPEAMVVRDFEQEVPGPRHHFRAMRLYRMRRILADLAAGRDVPHLIIQPQLLLPTGPGSDDWIHVSPDFMVLDPQLMIYLPGEEKSFIVREAGSDPGDLDLTRRQAGAQLIALRAEAGLQGLAERVVDCAVFVFATPYGLRPAPPVVERLDAAVHEIVRAIEVLGVVRAHLAALRAGGPAPLAAIAGAFPTHFQESCSGLCIMADVCAARAAAQARFLGDAAAELLGPNADLNRVVALMRGATPATPGEAAVASLLADAERALGYRPPSITRGKAV